MTKANEEWITSLRARQTAALDELRQRLVAGLRYALRGRYPVTDADIEDFAQEAVLRILDHLDTFRGESHFLTWAKKIAVRVAFSELRRSRWRNVQLEELLARYDDGDFTPRVLTAPAPTPEQQVSQRELAALVAELIAHELTPRQRRALVAVVLTGMPVEEVARRMDTNRNALYKLVHDARQRLKAQLLARGLSPQEVLAAFER